MSPGNRRHENIPLPLGLPDSHICGFRGVLNFSPSFRRRPESTLSTTFPYKVDPGFHRGDEKKDLGVGLVAAIRKQAGL